MRLIRVFCVIVLAGCASSSTQPPSSAPPVSVIVGGDAVVQGFIDAAKLTELTEEALRAYAPQHIDGGRFLQGVAGNALGGRCRRRTGGMGAGRPVDWRASGEVVFTPGRAMS